MIPLNIDRSHIVMALKKIDEQLIPETRKATKYQLIYKGKSYPPKFVISIANIYANGEELNPSYFSGGKESNNFLISNGFEVTNKVSNVMVFNKNPKKIVSSETNIIKTSKKHNQRCSDCKNSIIDMFRKLYGTVKVEHKMEIKALPEDYIKQEYYEDLQIIFNALVNRRGKKDFVRKKYLQPCDLYIPNPGFLVEIDESQHFTELRKTSLENYPEKLQTGFDVQKWISKCETINAKDNNPLYRDEQRAWYDTLRDFLPLIKNMQPTIRVAIADYNWCDLDPNVPKDVEKFKSIVFGKVNTISSKKKVLNMNEEKVRIATGCIQSEGRYTYKNRVKMLLDIIDRLDGHTDILLLPAGYFDTAYKANSIYQEINREISGFLKRKNSDLYICLGVDGRNGNDQMALSISKNGIESIARKFFPTAGEKSYLDAADSYLSKEDGHSRIFQVKNKTFYLAVCYDVFGIKKTNTTNPNVDAVLDLVHQFLPKGKGNSGHVFFARHGFAGASQKWKCPVFGAVVFFHQEIQRAWPTGVVWDGSKEQTKFWGYKDNPMNYYDELTIDSTEKVQVKFFEI